jgi:hypothetical protein
MSGVPVEIPDGYDIDAPVTDQDRADFRRVCETVVDISPAFIMRIEAIANLLFAATDADVAKMEFHELMNACGDYFPTIEYHLPGLFAKLRKRAGLPIPGSFDFEEDA